MENNPSELVKNFINVYVSSINLEEQAKNGSLNKDEQSKLEMSRNTLDRLAPAIRIKKASESDPPGPEYQSSGYTIQLVIHYARSTRPGLFRTVPLPSDLSCKDVVRDLKSDLNGFRILDLVLIDLSVTPSLRNLDNDDLVLERVLKLALENDTFHPFLVAADSSWSGASESAKEKQLSPSLTITELRDVNDGSIKKELPTPTEARPVAFTVVVDDGAGGDGSHSGPGTKIPKKYFDYESKLGSGGFGDVYLYEAKDELVSLVQHNRLSVKTKVVVKFAREKIEEMSEKARNQLDLEIAILKKLCSSAKGPVCHHFVEYYGEFRIKNHGPALCMEYCDYSLSSALRDGDGTLPVNRVKEITKSLLVALESMHSQALIHRDVKPENIMLKWVTIGGFKLGVIVKLIDFGISRSVPKTQSKTGSGTLEYSAPEQWNGAPDFKSDIWSLGMTVHQMLMGSIPTYNGNEYTWFQVRDQLKKSPELTSEWVSNVVKQYPKVEFLEKFLQSCLRYRKDDRCTAQELIKHPFLASVRTKDPIICFLGWKDNSDIDSKNTKSSNPLSSTSDWWIHKNWKSRFSSFTNTSTVENYASTSLQCNFPAEDVNGIGKIYVKQYDLGLFRGIIVSETMKQPLSSQVQSSSDIEQKAEMKNSLVSALRRVEKNYQKCFENLDKNSELDRQFAELVIIDAMSKGNFDHASWCFLNAKKSQLIVIPEGMSKTDYLMSLIPKDCASRISSLTRQSSAFLLASSSFDALADEEEPLGDPYSDNDWKELVTKLRNVSKCEHLLPVHFASASPSKMIAFSHFDLTLQDYISDETVRLTFDDAKNCIFGVWAGIAALHELDLFHGLVNLDNIVRKDGIWMLADYEWHRITTEFSEKQRGFVAQSSLQLLFVAPEVDVEVWNDGSSAFVPFSESWEIDAYSVAMVSWFVLHRVGFNHYRVDPFQLSPDEAPLYSLSLKELRAKMLLENLWQSEIVKLEYEEEKISFPLGPQICEFLTSNGNKRRIGESTSKILACFKNIWKMKEKSAAKESVSSCEKIREKRWKDLKSQKQHFIGEILKRAFGLNPLIVSQKEIPAFVWPLCKEPRTNLKFELISDFKQPWFYPELFSGKPHCLSPKNGSFLGFVEEKGHWRQGVPMFDSLGRKVQQVSMLIPNMWQKKNESWVSVSVRSLRFEQQPKNQITINDSDLKECALLSIIGGMQPPNVLFSYISNLSSALSSDPAMMMPCHVPLMHVLRKDPHRYHDFSKSAVSIIEIARGLQFLHHFGIFHGNISLDSIVVAGPDTPIDRWAKSHGRLMISGLDKAACRPFDNNLRRKKPVRKTKSVSELMTHINSEDSAIRKLLDVAKKMRQKQDNEERNEFVYLLRRLHGEGVELILKRSGKMKEGQKETMVCQLFDSTYKNECFRDLVWLEQKKGKEWLEQFQAIGLACHGPKVFQYHLDFLDDSILSKEKSVKMLCALVRGLPEVDFVRFRSLCAAVYAFGTEDDCKLLAAFSRLFVDNLFGIDDLDGGFFVSFALCCLHTPKIFGFPTEQNTTELSKIIASAPPPLLSSDPFKAPETHSISVSEEADIYSLGVVGAQLLAPNPGLPLQLSSFVPVLDCGTAGDDFACCCFRPELNTSFMYDFVANQLRLAVSEKINERPRAGDIAREIWSQLQKRQHKNCLLSLVEAAKQWTSEASRTLDAPNSSPLLANMNWNPHWKTKLKIYQDDLADLAVDAIAIPVRPNNPRPPYATVAESIGLTAGVEFDILSRAKVFAELMKMKNDSKLRTFRSEKPVIISGFDAAAKNVVFTVGPSPIPGKYNSEQNDKHDEIIDSITKNCYMSVLKACEERPDIETVALTLIGTGKGGVYYDPNDKNLAIKLEHGVHVCLESIREFLDSFPSGSCSLKTIILSVFKPPTEDFFYKTLTQVFSKELEKFLRSIRSSTSPTPSPSASPREENHLLFNKGNGSGFRRSRESRNNNMVRGRASTNFFVSKLDWETNRGSTNYLFYVSTVQILETLLSSLASGNFYKDSLQSKQSKVSNVGGTISAVSNVIPIVGGGLQLASELGFMFINNVVLPHTKKRKEYEKLGDLFRELSLIFLDMKVIAGNVAKRATNALYLSSLQGNSRKIGIKLAKICCRSVLVHFTQKGTMDRLASFKQKTNQEIKDCIESMLVDVILGPPLADGGDNIEMADHSKLEASDYFRNLGVLVVNPKCGKIESAYVGDHDKLSGFMVGSGLQFHDYAATRGLQQQSLEEAKTLVENFGMLSYGTNTENLFQSTTISDWSNQQVLSWLTKNGCESLISDFTHVQGSDLYRDDVFEQLCNQIDCAPIFKARLIAARTKIIY